MAVTQYIGARYVPLFADPIEWLQTSNYEPLTIVTYNGASYTSKQSVPAGTEITNTDYWVLTGNYNAQIEQYRKEVKEATAGLDTMKTDIATNADNIKTNTDDIASAKTDIATNADNIKTNTDDIASAKIDIATNAKNIKTNTDDIAAIKAKAAASGIYQDINYLMADTELTNDTYALMSNGSIWYITDELRRGDANGIDMVMTDSGLFAELVIEYPLNISHFAAGTFIEMVNRAFELSDSVYLPSDKYTIDGSKILSIPAGKRLFGDGNSTEIVCNSSSNNILLSGKYPALDHVKISGTGTGIAIHDTGWHTSISHITATGSNPTFLYVGGTAKNDDYAAGYLKDSNVYGNYTNGVIVQNHNDYYISNVIMNVDNSDGTGISLKDFCDAFTMEQCDILQFNYPLSTSATTYEPSKCPSFCTFTDCYFDSGETVNLGNMMMSTFTNCWFSNGRQTSTHSSNSGVALTDCIGITFDACKFYNNGYNALLFNKDAYFCKVVGCTFGYNNRENAGYGSIQLGSNCNNNMFSNCTFTDDYSASTGTRYTQYGIKFSSTLSNIIVNGCIFQDTGTALVNTGSVTNLVNSNNIGV